MYVLYMSKKSSLYCLLKFLLIIPMTDLALAADLTLLGFKSSVMCRPTPKSFSSAICYVMNVL